MIDLNNDAQLKLLIADINTNQNITRKEDINDGHQILHGNMKHYVKKRLEELWPNSAKWFRLHTGSVTKKVIKKVAKAFQKPPIRKLSNNGKESAETTEYSDILKNGKYLKAAQEYDETFNLDDYACMWVNMIQSDKDDGGIQRDYVFRALNQSEFDRKVNKQTLKTDVFIVSMPESLVLEQINGDSQKSILQDEDEDRDTMAFYAIWTATQHVMVAFSKKREEVKRLEIVGNENGINPIGRIPAFFDQRVGEATLPPRPSMPFADIELAACKSVLLSGCDIQALGKMVIKHPEDQDVSKKLFDSPFTHLLLPQKKKEGTKETTAEYINASPNIASFQEVLDKFEKDIVEEKGIGVEAVGDASFSSGMDRSVAMKSELDLIESNQMRYCEMEEDVFNIIQSFEAAAESGKFQNAEFSCGFPKHEPIQSRKALLDEIKLEMELGTMEPFEKHIRLNPNLTEAEAIEKEDKIQKSRADKLKTLMTSKPPFEEKPDADRTE